MKYAVLILLVSPLAVSAAETNINAATIYTPVFSNIAAWTQAHPDFRFVASNVASPEAQAAFTELIPQIRAMEGVDRAAYVDWGTKFDDGFAAKLDYLSPALKAMRVANWASIYASSNQLQGYFDFAVDATRVARDVGEDRLLIDLLAQISGELPALEQLTRFAGHMQPNELDQLDEKLAAMPAGTSIAEAMQMEKTLFVNTMITKLLRAMESADTNWFEVVTAEGGGTNSAAEHTGTTTNTATGGRWLAQHLRLTSIVDTGTSLKIGFDSDELGSFAISLGRPKFGIELLSVDFTRGTAVIARGTETALVRLKAREIMPFKLKLKMPPAGAADSEKNPLAALVAATTTTGGGPNEETMRKELLDAIGDGTADGLMKYLQRVAAEYDQWIAAYKAKPHDEFKMWSTTFIKGATGMTKTLLPAIDRIMEKEQKLIAARANLAAAITARRAELKKQ